MTTILLILAMLLLVLAGLWRLLGLTAWAEARAAGLEVALGDVVRMRLRGTSPMAVIRPAIIAHKMDVRVERRLLEAHHLAGGDPMRVLTAVIAARKARLEVPFETIAEVDLRGGDPVEEIAALLRERAGER